MTIYLQKKDIIKQLSLTGLIRNFIYLKATSMKQSKIMTGPVWNGGKQPDWENMFQHRGRFVFEDFDWEDDYNTYGVTAVYEKHMAGPCSSVAPYWGLGAGFSAFSDKDTDDVGDTFTYSGSGYSFFGVLGFEWGFTNCMTFGGEYGLGFASSSTEYELDVGGVANTFNEHEYTTVGFGTASVYLSVYW